MHIYIYSYSYQGGKGRRENKNEKEQNSDRTKIGKNKVFVHFLTMGWKRRRTVKADGCTIFLEGTNGQIGWKGLKVIKVEW